MIFAVFGVLHTSMLSLFFLLQFIVILHLFCLTYDKQLTNNLLCYYIPPWNFQVPNEIVCLVEHSSSCYILSMELHICRFPCVFLVVANYSQLAETSFIVKRSVSLQKPCINSWYKITCITVINRQYAKCRNCKWQSTTTYKALWSLGLMARQHSRAITSAIL